MIESENNPFVTVVGGGPAGSVTAARLAQSGVSTLLLERDHFPRDKLCGEFLAGESLGILREIGCLDEILAADPARIQTAAFVTTSGREIRLSLRVESLGIRRRILDRVLFEAAAQAGARVIEGARVTNVDGVANDDSGPRETVTLEYDLGGPTRKTRSVDSRFAVLAHGRRGALDKSLGRAFLDEPSTFVAFQQHYRPRSGPRGDRLRRELRGMVELYLVPGGYCGVSFIDGGLVNVCTLLEERELRDVGGGAWDAVRTQFATTHAALARRLDALESVGVEESTRAVAGIPFQAKDIARNRVLFVGDSAAVIAPLCGEGQAIALDSGYLLAELIARAERGEVSGDIAASWRRTWSKRFGRRLATGRMLQRILLSGSGGERLLRVVRRIPGVAGWLLSATRGRPIVPYR